MTWSRIARSGAGTALALLLLRLPAAPAAVLPEARPLLERLERAIAPLRDFEAEFVQVRHLALTDEEVRAAGRLRFLAPDHFRLDYHSPEADVLSMRGDTLEVYFPSQRQLQRYPVDDGEATRSLLLLFAARPGRLEEEFDVSLAPPSPAGRALRLQPLADALDYPVSEIQVTLNARTGLPERLFFREEGGDTILLRLDGPKTNRGLKRPDFILVPPPGTEIISR